MIKFEIWGISVSVTFGFLFLSSVFLICCPTRTALLVSSACLIHELGHCFAAVILNVKFRKLMLWSGGISITPQSRIISYRSEITVLVSGPFFNLVFAGLCAAAKANDAMRINLTLAFFNMLPFKSLDGGCTIRLLKEMFRR